MSNLKNKIERGISEFYLNLDKEVIKESFKEEGADVKSEDEKIAQFVNRIKYTHKCKVDKEKTDKILEKIVSKFQDAINRNIEKPIATLHNLIKSKELSVQFRNLEKLTTEEIKEIIKGKNLVDLMDELEDDID